MNIALLEVSHWHYPLYEQALQRCGAQVIAVCDRDPGARERVAARFGARSYADSRSLLQSERPDFAFVFGRHCDMSGLGLELIDRGIPFAIEKPGGTCAAQVRAMHERACAAGLFVAVPFVQLVSPLYAVIRTLIDDEGARFTHSSWRFFAGPPRRYVQCGNEWMLDPRSSGGGCLINLAPHFIDLAHRVHGTSRGSIVSRLSHATHATAVEDYAMVSLSCSQGATALVETGYCFPEHGAKREFSFSLVSATHYLRSSETGITVYRATDGSSCEMSMDLDADPLYGLFVERVLNDVRNGQPPLAGLADLVAVMEVVDAAAAHSP